MKMGIKRKMQKAVRKGKKAVKKAMKTETAQEIVRREKLIAADLLIQSAKKLKAEAQKEKKKLVKKKKR
jgi:hypothetical protein